MTERARARSRGIVVYIAALGALTAATLVAGSRLSTGQPVPWVALPPIFAALVIAGAMLVRFQDRDAVMALDLFEAVLAPAIFLFPPAIVALLAGGAQAIAEGIRRNETRKATFNVVQWMLAASAGSITFRALVAGDALTLPALGAVLVALAVVVAVNLVAFALVVRIATGQPAMGVARSVAPALARGWAVNVSFGAMLVAGVGWHPAIASGLFLVPLIWLHRSFRGIASVSNDRARLVGLRHASQALTGPGGLDEILPRFLREVRISFAGEAVDLVFNGPDGPAFFRVGGGGPLADLSRVDPSSTRTLAAALAGRDEPIRVNAGSTDLELAELLRREGWRDCTAAPVTAGDDHLGVLCVYDRIGLEGFEEGDLDVLAALGREAGAVIRKASLLDEVLKERRKLSEIVTLASDGIMTVAADGTIQTWNPGMEEITRLTAGEMVGARTLGILRPRDADGADLMLERWAHSDTEPPAMMQIVDRDGGARWLSCTFTRVTEPDGRPRLLIVVARDVTRARQTEQMKDDFVATVSHELRTPLTPIKGWAATMIKRAGELTADEYRIAAESIFRQAENLERLIMNLLTASQVERSSSVERDEIVDAVATATKVVEEARNARPERQIRLHADQGCLARGNEVWVERICANLLSNALKYAPPHEPIDVEVRRHGSSVVISVRDRGPGIPERDAEAIFERFRRLGDHSTRSEGGAGLGLYIARQLATSIGATVSVDGSSGNGATFTVTLRGTERLTAVG